MKIMGDEKYEKILYWNDLTEDEKNELINSYETVKESSFFRYDNNIFDINDFLIIKLFEGYDAVYNFSAFDGILIKVDSCGEYVRIHYYMI